MSSFPFHSIHWYICIFLCKYTLNLEHIFFQLSFLKVIIEQVSKSQIPILNSSLDKVLIVQS